MYKVKQFLGICHCSSFHLFYFSLSQEAVTKATGKKNKTQVQLDMEDILTALAKHQQAMKARQITNTKPLSFAGAYIHNKT